MFVQVSSGKYNGLVWDNPEKTMFRIPWKHAGKQDFRSDEDAAIFKVSAPFLSVLHKLHIETFPYSEFITVIMEYNSKNVNDIQ